MKTFFIRAEVLTVSLPDGEVDVDVDVYEMTGETPEEALDNLKALLNQRTEWHAKGVHSAEVIGCEEDAEVEFLN